jgi:spore germination protein GerM
MKRLLAVTAAAGMLVVAAASCGMGGDDQLRQINDDDLFGLDETTTSTTTTSTTTTTTIGFQPSVQPTIGATSTTIATESVQLYFLDGNRLQPVTIDLAGTATPSRVLAALESGPPAGDLGIGLRTLLPEETTTIPALVNRVEPSNLGYVTVDLATPAFELIDSADQRAAIAQIVLTLINRPGIGQVKFTLDGVPMRVPGREGLQSEAGGLVSLEDYQSLLVDTAATTTTTTLAAAVPPGTPPAG